MSARKKCPPPGASKAYLVSFGDTMTALLAFFIVLNSLAEEQTGANLHAGTGSFVQALKAFGLPGMFSEQLSSQAFQLDNPAPLYIVAPETLEEPGRDAEGPDDEADRRRIIDREQEDYQRFLYELSRWNDLSPTASVDGEVVFDLFTPPRNKPPHAPPELLSAARQVAPVLRRKGYEVDLTVWATTPSDSAWSRAADWSVRLRRELVDYLRLSEVQGRRFRAGARPWGSSTAERPTMSITVRRLK